MTQRTDTGLYFDAERRELQARDREMIPTRLVLAMAGLALASLALVSFAVLTERPAVGAPHAAAQVAERQMILSGNGVAARAATPDGRVLMDAENGGFIAVVTSGLDRARVKARVEDNPPVTLTRFANGRLRLSDPATGWSTELTSFGAGNALAWTALFEK
ncbi:photosynthetic complex assembly protein PuhC [Tranquillimonas rosea]|uniref:photosynthetic complex assembly protein PuhC n=1 Tax=Tranquillimonas rosea TaxID=641238 RepID=UPI003BA9F03F